jgi:hypothetical protein
VTRRAARKVVEGSDASYDWGQSSRDGWVRSVGKVLLAPNGVAMHIGAEGSVDHTCGPTEFNAGAGGVDLNTRETVAGEPGSDGGEIAVGWAEGGTERLRSEPLVVSRRGLVLLLVNELSQGGLLLRAALQEENDAAKGGGVG